MNRKELEEYIRSNYSAEPDHPWVKYPNYIVFRHQSNKKWFAIIMDVPKNKLGLQENDILDVVNFKGQHLKFTGRKCEKLYICRNIIVNPSRLNYRMEGLKAYV